MTNFEKMMETMMEQYMEKMMEATMMKMMSSMMPSTPEVAKAEVATRRTPQTLSKEEFFAISEKVDEPVTPVELDFVVYGNKTAKYNKPVASDIWTINHLEITSKYNAKYSVKNKGYIFESPSALRNFLTSYQIITTLSDDDKIKVAEYKKARAKAKAEYYANLAK